MSIMSHLKKYTLPDTAVRGTEVNRMGKRQNDLTGQRFGRLIVIQPTLERRNGYAVWRCRCECGNEILVSSRHLKNGWVINCGCIPKSRKGADLTGERFGRLLVLRKEQERGLDGQVCWRCQCDCGNQVITTTGQLRAGYKKSCGCLSRPPLKEWVGRQFGSLKVVSYTGKWNGKHYWRCRCECGKETVVSQSNLKNGHTKSCGHRATPQNSKHFVEGTCIENIRSRKIFANNTSGIRGVYKSKRSGKWQAQITFQGKTRYLGSYEKLEDAARARAAGEELFDEFLEKYDQDGWQRKERGSNER